MPHISLRNDLFGVTSLLDFRPRTAVHICALTDLVMRGPSTLTEAERELIATHVSHLNDCTFCCSAHGAVACQAPGGSEELVDFVKNDPETAPLSDKMRRLLHLAGKVQRGGYQVAAENAEAARQAGATDLEIHDTVLIAALFCMYNRYVDGLGTALPPDPAFFTALGQRIHQRGYVMPEDGYHALKY